MLNFGYPVRIKIAPWYGSERKKWNSLKKTHYRGENEDRMFGDHIFFFFWDIIFNGNSVRKSVLTMASQSCLPSNPFPSSINFLVTAHLFKVEYS